MAMNDVDIITAIDSTAQAVYLMSVVEVEEVEEVEVVEVVEVVLEQNQLMLDLLQLINGKSGVFDVSCGCYATKE